MALKLSKMLAKIEFGYRHGRTKQMLWLRKQIALFAKFLIGQYTEMGPQSQWYYLMSIGYPWNVESFGAVVTLVDSMVATGIKWLAHV